MSNTLPSVPVRAVRLIFEYEGNQLRLVTQQPVEMVITGPDITQVERPGYYVDTRDVAGQTLSRVMARNAFATSAEVFPERAGEPIIRVDVAEPRGAFTIVVPAPENADHVTVVQVISDEPEIPEPGSRTTSPVPERLEVIDLASFPLEFSGGGTP
jgi:hypothetical protein